MFTQLNPPLPVFIVSKGSSALAHGVIDYGPEHHLHWVCFMQDSGECWTVANPDVRMEWNATLGRRPRRVNPQTSPVSGETAGRGVAKVRGSGNGSDTGATPTHEFAPSGAVPA